ncbi:MAG: VWA domain-containing protein [Flavobacterium sp.]
MYELDKPLYLYLLALVPVLVALYLYEVYWQRKKQREFGNSELVEMLVPGRSVFKQALKWVVLVLTIACVILAIVNPKIGTKVETVKREGIDIVFALDVSKSMLAEDMAPSRLDRSKQIVSQIINGLGSDRVGMVGYAGAAYPVLPITTDYGVARMFLEGVNTDIVSSQGTAIGAAVDMAATFFDDPDSSKLVILLSDGEDHGEDSIAAAERAKEKGIKIITVGLGTTKGGPIPMRRNGIIQGYKQDSEGNQVTTKLYPEALQALAQVTGGGYISGQSTKAVTDYVKNTIKSSEKTGFESRRVSEYDSQYQWFLAVAFLLLIIDFFLLEKKTAWINRLNLFNEKEQ